jgi:Transglycosylase SLT domain
MDRTAVARLRRVRRAALAALWTACALAGLGAGLLLAAPEAEPAHSATPPDPRAAALARAFGPPCGPEVPPPPVALVAPLDGLYVRYVQARCLAAAGRLGEAAEALRAGLDVPHAAPALWRWQRLQALALAGDDDGALAELEALLTSNPGPLLLERTRGLVAALAVAPGSAPAPRHADYLVTYLEHVTPRPEDYDLLLRLWELSDSPQGQARRRALALLMWRTPRDEAGAARWAALPAAGAGADGGFAGASADYAARAERLFALGLHERLVAELDDPALPRLEPVYGKGVGRLYFRALIRAEHLQQAAVQVNTGSVMERFSFDRRQQLIWAIRIQLKRRKIGPVLKHVDELKELAPTDEELPAIYLELLKYNEGRHDRVTEMYWLDRIVKEFGDSSEASDAYWQVIWNAIERRDYARARPLLERAIKDSGAFDPVDQARLLYWRGRLQVLAGDKAAGEATWHDMEEQWPYGYYTAMAQWRRNGSTLAMHNGADGNAPPRVAAPRIAALWGIEPFPRALFLFAVGESELGSEALRDVVAQQMPDDALEEASALFFYLERHYLQLRLVANHHLDTLRHSKVDGSVLWKRAFPRPHWGVVERLAAEHQMDPYFIFAIMREESRFFSSAYSTAGAKGLMQLMPSTARQVAQRNGLAYDEELLHTPEFNIPIGTMYLKRVLERFDGNPVYAAAAYNAGPSNVQRWVKRYGSLPLDEFVERIPFGETQRYVKRVFLSYQTYSKLYR